MPLESLLALKLCDLVSGEKINFFPDSRGKGRPHPRKFSWVSPFFSSSCVRLNVALAISQKGSEQWKRIFVMDTDSSF